MGFTVFTFIKCTSVVMAVLRPCVADHFPPLRDVSYEWIDEFHVNVSWQKPAGEDQCKVYYLVDKQQHIKTDPFHNLGITTEEMGSTGFNYTIETIHTMPCISWNNSKPLTISIHRQDELVTDFTCFLYIKNAMNCSWKPVKQFQDLKVFYRLCENSAANSDKHLSACEDRYSNRMRHGCYLKGKLHTDDVCILVNGTYLGRTVRNTFKRRPSHNVKPPPPTLTVTEKGDNLSLSWNQPDIGQRHCWGYVVNYTKCGESTQLKEVMVNTSVTVTYDDRCRYEIQIRAVFHHCGKGGSDLSEVVTYGRDDWSLTVAAIVIPAILSACVILSCYCLRRHKAIICPIVPDPSVIFKEMMMNRSKEPMLKTAVANFSILHLRHIGFLLVDASVVELLLWSRKQSPRPLRSVPSRVYNGQISPPRNVSLSWVNEFCANLTWAPPENLGDDCKYYLKSVREIRKGPDTLFHEYYTTREGGPLSFAFQTECDTKRSEPVVISTTYPELVRDFQCFIYSSNLTKCSWLPHKHILDLQLSYQSISVIGAVVWCFAFNDSRECSAYDYKGDVKTGCRLQGNHLNSQVLFLFRGMLNDTPVINTFHRHMLEHIRPPPIHFTLTQVGDQLNVNWTPPNIGNLDLWTYHINYTECKEQKALIVKGGISTSLNIVPYCQYSIAIKAVFMDGKGVTPLSDSKLFSPPQLYTLMYATIIIPVAFAALAALALVCFRKHKEKIFPKVPQPRDLLRDIRDNNNDLSTFGNLYVPAQEEEECKITLAIDPQE